jgi:hypothetical protein
MGSFAGSKSKQGASAKGYCSRQDYRMIAQIGKRRAASDGVKLKHSLFLAGFCCFLFGAICFARTYSNWSDSHWWSAQSNEQQRANVAFETSHIGTIVMNGPGSYCQRFKYDNDTGQTVADSRPCDETVGVQDRGGRLDAISKSFLAK